jgi:hypothetical protein
MPIIAIIVSDTWKRCNNFLIFHQLNPSCFKTAIKPQDLVGYSSDVPIIITYHEWLDNKMREVIYSRFRSVRFIDY